MTDLANLNIRVQQSGVNETNVSLARLKTEARGAAQGVKELDAENRKAQSSATSLSGSIGTLYRAIGGLSAGYVALKSVRMVDEFTLLEGRVRTSTQSIEEANYAWNELLTSAKQTGIGLDASVSILQRISLVRDEVGATTDEMLQFTDTVQKLGAAGGATGDALKFGLTQLGQSLSNEIVRAEEFNSIMENIPAVGKQIADELGVTTGQLRNLVINGELLSKDVFAAILNSTDEANQKFSQLPETVGRAFSILTIRVQEMLKEFDDAAGATDFLIAGIDLLGNALEYVFNKMEELAYGLRAIFVGITGSIAAYVTELVNQIEMVVNIGVRAVNLFKENDLALVDFNGGVTSDQVGAETRSEVGDLLNKAASSGGEADSAVRKSFGIEGEEISKRENATRAQKSYADALKESNKEEEKAAKQIEKVIENLKFKNSQMGLSIEDQELYNELRAAGVEIDTAAGRQIEELVRQHQELSREQKILESVIDSVDSGFKRLWTGAISGGEDWRSAMKGIVDDVASMFYDLFIKNDLRKLIGGLMGGGESGGGFGDLLGSAGGFLSGIFGGGLSSGSISLASSGSLLSGFASGGEFEVGGTGGTDSQLVAFRASPDETVSIRTPGQQEGGGGTTVQYYIDARGADMGVEERVLNALRTVDKSIESRAMNAVDVAFKRNPAYGRR